MFTPHQLELFYYVAKYQGISAAARRIPYGIGQPAISGQMIEMERRLGAPLFERKPFKLTEKGELLYAHIKTHYDELPALLQQLQDRPVERLYLVVDDLIGVGLLSAVVTAIARQHPSLVLEIHTASQAKVEASLAGGEADVIITTSERAMPGVRSALLARVTPVLLVSQKAAIKTPGHFWAQTPIAERLIYPVETGLVHHTFERGLSGMQVNWRPSIRVNSQAVMREMVASGQGVGVGLALPEAALDPRIRAIPLKHFDPIPVTVCWKTRVKPVVAATVAIIREIARQQWKVEADKMVK